MDVRLALADIELVSRMMIKKGSLFRVEVDPFDELDNIPVVANVILKGRIVCQLCFDGFYTFEDDDDNRYNIYDPGFVRKLEDYCVDILLSIHA